MNPLKCLLTVSFLIGAATPALAVDLDDPALLKIGVGEGSSISLSTQAVENAVQCQPNYTMVLGNFRCAHAVQANEQCRRLIFDYGCTPHTVGDGQVSE